MSIKETRKLIRKIPQLVKASLINEALSLEKAIAATFDFSDEMRDLLGGLPQGYSDKLFELYSKIMFSAYEAGGTHAKIEKPVIMPTDDKEKEIAVRLPMPKALGDELEQQLITGITTILNSFENKEKILIQLKKDVEKSYIDGVLSELEAMEGDQEKSQRNVLIEQIMLKTGDSDKLTEKNVIIDYANAKLIDLDAVPTESLKKMLDAKKTATAATHSKEDIIRKLIQYTKLLPTPEAQKVLRYTLGISDAVSDKVEKADSGDVKQVKADLESNISFESQTRPLPYDLNRIRSKLEGLVKQHDYTEEDPQTILVDCVLADTPEFTDEEKCHIVCTKLGLGPVSDFSECEAQIDSLAEQITTEASMPGKFVFVDDGHDLCLVYAFEKPMSIENAIACVKKSAKSVRNKK